MKKIYFTLLLILAVAVIFIITSYNKKSTDESYFNFSLLDDGTYAVSCKSKYGDFKKVVIPSTYKGKDVSAIKDYGFNGNYKLRTVIIPDTIKYIGNYAFWVCSNLKNIAIPNSVTNIGEYAFNGCSALTSIEIPNSVTSIGFSAFSGCSNLTYNEFDNGLYLGNTNNPYVVLVKAKDETITSCTINEHTKIIYSYAFYSCSSLESITLPFVGNGSDETHCGYIFGASSYSDNGSYVPTSLKSVTITGSTSIDDYAFKSCSNLTSIVIPNSVTGIGRYAFQGCSSLESITLPFVGNGSDETHFGYIFGASSYSDNSRYVPTSLKTVTITGSTSIDSSAFYYCSKLTSIVIPNSVTSIGGDAFKSCSSLESITLPFVGNGSDKTHFGYIFGASSYSNNSGSVPTSLKSVTITGGTSIGGFAFYGCSNLTSIEIPNSVTSIGNYAFQSCSALTSIEIPNSVTSIGDHAFYGCSSLTSIVIPNSVTSIGDHAFYGCSSLTSIVIPSSVTSIGGWAFEYCSKLTIYCEAESKPSGWSSYWNDDNRPVVWGHKG